jgi:plastocyanin
LIRRFRLTSIIFAIVLLPAFSVVAKEWVIKAKQAHGSFHPAKLQISTGDTVTWINSDTVLHEVRFPIDPTAESQNGYRRFLSRGKKLSITFSNSGSYSYYCSWHGMFGTIEVGLNQE